MKVCMVSTAPPRLCGIANYCIKLAKVLSKERSCQLLIVADNHNSTHKNIVEMNGQVKIKRVWTHDSFLYPFEIFRAILSEKPDIVHIQHEFLLFGTPQVSGLFSFLLLLLYLFRKHIIITIHSVIPRSHLTASFFNRYGLGKRLGVLAKFYMYFMTLSMGFLASKVIVHLKSAKETLVKDYKYRPNDIAVIPHGVDVYELNIDPYDAKKKLNLNGKRTLLFFGFIEPKKGIEHLIEAMPIVESRYSDVVLMIIGNYHPRLTPNGIDYLKQLKTIVHELGIDDNVIFVSKFIPNEEIPLYLAATDIAVFPYIETDILGASGALSSIASFKKPIIATRIGRFREDITDGENGLLVHPANPASLARAINSLLFDTEKGKKMGARLYNEVKDKHWENVAHKTLALYKDSVFRSESSIIFEETR